MVQARFLWAALACLLGTFGVPAVAGQLTLLGAGKASTTAAYVGVGDIKTGATAYFGSRAYTAAQAAAATQTSFDLRRASDNATCTPKVGTSGYVDVTVGTPCNSNTQTVTAWIGASSATVSKAYNLSGGAIGDPIQATAGNQPTLILSCSQFNNKPCLEATSATMVLATAGSFAPATTGSFSAVANRTVGTNPSNQIIANAGQFNGLSFDGGNTVAIYANSTHLTASATDAVSHALNGIVNGASSLIMVDGVDSSTSSLTQNTLSSFSYYAGGAGSTTIRFAEGGYWDAIVFSAGERGSINSQQRSSSSGWNF